MFSLTRSSPGLRSLMNVPAGSRAVKLVLISGYVLISGSETVILPLLCPVAVESVTTSSIPTSMQVVNQFDTHLPMIIPLKPL